MIRSVAIACIALWPVRMSATSCAYPPPCARLHANSILFTGTVVDAGVLKPDTDQTEQEIRLDVKEIFAGLPAKTERVSIKISGSWIEKGSTYLIDGSRGAEGFIRPGICGATAQIEPGQSNELVDFLRRRRSGKTDTTLGIRISSEAGPASNIAVKISGPRERTAVSNEDGIAHFANVVPGIYKFSIAEDHYSVERAFPEEVDVLAGTCPSASLNLKADGEISGFVHDIKGKPVAGITLEINGAQSTHQFGPWFQTKSDSDGYFRFSNVVPGRYYLGTNLLKYSKSSPIPQSFYPGSRAQSGGVPIEVSLGSKIENLVFTLPDFGKRRDIRLCVVDASGKTLEGAVLHDALNDDPAIAALGRDLKTDSTGCVTIEGYTLAQYRMSALYRTGALLDAQFSDPVTIPEGEATGPFIAVVNRSFRAPARK